MLIDSQTIFFKFFVIFFVTIFCVIVNKFNTDLSLLTEIKKCPFCYGKTLCREIDDGTLLIENTDFISIFNNFFGVKNVYYGKYKDIKVVMKKLAQNHELKRFDDTICNRDEICFVDDKKINFFKLITMELTKINDPNVKFKLCPDVSRIDKLIDLHETILNDNRHEYIWTAIKINPEPIFLQILKPEDDWPTPKYFGECGRLIVEEYVGPTLTDFFEKPWIVRARIVSSLLKAVHKFTFKNLNFGFYLTDVSMDNIAVNRDYEAIFVDLENVIVVDKNPTEKVLSSIETWNETHISEIHTDCQDCFLFSQDDICNHKISDHNYFAVCQIILGPNFDNNMKNFGFLYDPPDEILKKYKTLINLIEKCFKPDTKTQSRITIGIELQKVLDSILMYKKFLI